MKYPRGLIRHELGHAVFPLLLTNGVTSTISPSDDGGLHTRQNWNEYVPTPRDLYGTFAAGPAVHSDGVDCSDDLAVMSAMKPEPAIAAEVDAFISLNVVPLVSRLEANGSLDEVAAILTSGSEAIITRTVETISVRQR